MLRLASPLLVAALALSACGGDGDGAESSAPATSAPIDVSLVPATPAPTVPVPSVDVPEDVPTELEVTELRSGRGRTAMEGDAVIVRYVGVSSTTGELFDDNYDADPYSITLGEGGSIEGFDAGLIGARAGARVQIDVPADQAYGAAPTTVPGSTTTSTLPGQAPPYGPLTFVVDVLGVIPPTDPAAAPTADDFQPSATPVPAVVTEDVIDGDGAAAAAGQTAIVNFVLARGDNGAVLRSTWDDEAPTQMFLAPSGQMDGMVDGIEGMRVGGRRLITVPFELAFGAGGLPPAGLPAETDVQVIVDLLAVY